MRQSCLVALSGAGRFLFGAFLILFMLLLWFIAVPVYAAAKFLDWLDEKVDREFNKLFGGW